jgi:hypothetical protein
MRGKKRKECKKGKRMVREVAMTIKETVDIIRESSLWQTLTIVEKAEVLAHVMETAQSRADENIPRENIAERARKFFRN